MFRFRFTPCSIAQAILLGIVILSLAFIVQTAAPAICTAHGSCPEPAAYGRQPFPDELVDVFDRAGTNRLGSEGPDLPQIWKGYPPSEAKLISPYVPCILLKAIGYTESTGWKQFDAEYGQYGYTVLNESTCDYGVMQINAIHFDDPAIDQSRVAAEPAYNVGTGARILIQKWNSLAHYIGNNNPYVVEDWYHAVWAYHGGLREDGTLTWDGNPNNPNYPWPRGEWLCWQGGQNPNDWPYQEKIWGCATNPPGSEFWEAVLLTLPPRDDLYTYEGGPPPTHIDTPQPSHGSCSVVYLPAVLKNYPPCAQPIQNGDFEAGSAYWTLGGATTISTLTPHSGSYSAWLGGYNNANDTLYQTVIIPSTGPTGQPVVSAWLGYYWYMTTEETSHSWDYLYVKIRDAYGNDLTTLETLSDGSTANTWGFSRFDVSAYIGQTIQVYFRATTDGSYKTSFFIDDVAHV